nr:MAG TPA: hypothetical protein [Caudoviricetes sp.]
MKEPFGDKAKPYVERPKNAPCEHNPYNQRTYKQE